MNYIGKYYPQLSQKIGFVPLGRFPTPVGKLSELRTQLKCNCNLLIKRDDISGDIYGGNKIRKLEYILGEALKQNASRVITTGAIGSNHALAVATYAKKLGLKAVLMLFGEQDGEHVKNNLIADFLAGAEMHYDLTYEDYLVSLPKVIDHYRKNDGHEPFFIPAGGTSEIGMLGYINAAFELKDQIDHSTLDTPDFIFVPFGTMGTAAGLSVGCKLAKIKTKIIAIQVVDSFVADSKKFYSLIEKAITYYKTLDNSFPDITIESNEIILDKKYFGSGYGLSTPEGNAAIKKFSESQKILLDEVYSGKAAAAFINYAQAIENRDKTLLFWDTKNSIPTKNYLQNYKELPEPFHRFFKN